VVPPGQDSAQARRQVLRTVFMGAAIGAIVFVGFGFLWPELETWIHFDPGQSVARVRIVFLGAGLFLVAPLVGFAVWLWRLGTRALAEDRFPPPGVAIIGDAPDHTGDAARWRARLAQALAIFLVVAAATIAFLIWRLAYVLMGS
jgi:hypothetical protein